MQGIDRRSFLYGLAGGAVAGAGGLMLVQSIPYPKTPFPNGLVEYFANTGATIPFLGPALYPSALYDSGSDTTWLGFEGWDGTKRLAQVTSYDHSTGYWSDIVAAGFSPLTDDDHGTPALCLDDEGYLHAFHGSHNTDQQYSSTRWAVTGSPGDGSMWAIRAPIAGTYTYPHPVSVGSDIYLFLRKYISANPKYPLYLRKTASLVAGEATWNAEVALVDFGDDTRFYMGTVLKSGTDIWIVATKADDTDTFREHVYLFIYDTTTGAIKNHDASTSVASGSLPIDLTTADSDFRLFTHSGGNDDGGAPSLRFDTNGDPHILFKDGTGSSYAVKHIMKTGGSWTSPTTIATVDSRYNCPILVQRPGGAMEAWYALDPDDAFTRFGNMVRRTRSSGGTWGAEQTILEADTVGLGNPTGVLDGDAGARVIFAECLDSPLDSGAGDLKMYLYGNAGLVSYEAAPAAVNAGTADGNELREDGSIELREDASNELRETA